MERNINIIQDLEGKRITKELGISLSGANYKIKALKREGRIYFEGKGGLGSG